MEPLLAIQHVASLFVQNYPHSGLSTSCNKKVGLVPFGSHPAPFPNIMVVTATIASQPELSPTFRCHVHQVATAKRGENVPSVTDLCEAFWGLSHMVKPCDTRDAPKCRPTPCGGKGATLVPTSAPLIRLDIVLRYIQYFAFRLVSIIFVLISLQNFVHVGK